MILYNLSLLLFLTKEYCTTLIGKNSGQDTKLSLILNIDSEIHSKILSLAKFLTNNY